MADADLKYMRLALREARKGLGRTSPNPAVGAVVVKNNKVVGRGYHERAGAAHAEVNALQDAGRKAKNSTLYVTLEPCNHMGRTPPCTEAVLGAGVSRIVIGMADPNPGVAGGGAGKLAAAGVAVSMPILEDACREINLPFIKHTVTGHPWVIMKAGMSIDGRIAAAPGKATRITGDRARLHLHKLRNRVDAILVGINTVLVDDPSLNTRLPKNGRSRDPLRVVLDADLQMPEKARMLQQQSEAGTWIFCGKKADRKKCSRLEEAGAVIKRIRSVKGRLDLQAVISELGKNQVTSLLVEGGSKVHGAFLEAGLVDQLLLYVAPGFIGGQGVPLASFASEKTKQGIASRLTIKNIRRLGDDVLVDGRFHHK